MGRNKAAVFFSDGNISWKLQNKDKQLQWIK